MKCTRVNRYHRQSSDKRWKVRFHWALSLLRHSHVCFISNELVSTWLSFALPSILAPSCTCCVCCVVVFALPWGPSDRETRSSECEQARIRYQQRAEESKRKNNTQQRFADSWYGRRMLQKKKKSAKRDGEEEKRREKITSNTVRSSKLTFSLTH